MSRHVEGRRVESMEAIERPGDYFVKYVEGGRIGSLWFAMPGFGDYLWNRINGPGASQEPRWSITEDAEGRVTVDPSIRSQWTYGKEPRCFHGFLRGGVWEVLDDSVGAVF